MPLTQDQEDREHELRVDQMTINIEKMRNDMAFQQKQREDQMAFQQKQREDQLAWETRRFVVSILVGAAACVAAGVALANYVNSRPPPVAYLPAPTTAPR